MLVATTQRCTAIATIAAQVAGPAAAAVDDESRFPAEAIAALREANLFSVAVPEDFGGQGWTVRELLESTTLLAQSCSATGMIWAMHHLQVACIVAHAAQQPYFAHWLREQPGAQRLVASVTSEVGIGGGIRTSHAALDVRGETLHLQKQASTVSYGAYADAFLVTARRSVAAREDDQVLALVARDQTELVMTSPWRALGMRGTCSPGMAITARFPSHQLFAVPFATVCQATMVPVSHLLWGACWLGIAQAAVRTARSCLRARARTAQGQTGVFDPRMSDLAARLGAMQAVLARGTASYEERLGVETQEGEPDTRYLIHMNELKLSLSELCVQVTSLALAICGLQGYLRGSRFSVERQLRDSYAAICMIDNERLRATNAALLLLPGNEP
jgi:acyl-CoA dehydrogenase